MAGIAGDFIERFEAAGRRFAASDRLERLVHFLNSQADAERGRLGLWAPVFLGAGAASYFAMPSAPPFWLAPFALTLIALLFWKRRTLAIALAPVALFALGAAAAEWREAAVRAPILKRELGVVLMKGRLVAIDEAPSGRHLVIAPLTIGRLDERELPARIRVSWRGKVFAARPGDLVQLRADLSPPPQPVLPGGFDFARQLYFQRIGAVGFAVTPPAVVENTRRSFGGMASAAVEEFRVRLARRITSAAKGDAGAIVAAVVTGKREAISEKAEGTFRDAGLSHLLAISGLHMGLATGLIFFALRAALALNEKIALTRPIKKWAAIAALVSGVLYLILSGHSWSAQRAFLMSAIVFLAIIFDRRALSLRTVAIAAFVILLLAPEAVLHPGFQMSFAAATALIAAYEIYSRNADPGRSFAWPAIVRRYFIGIVITDTIAAIATAPFSLFHFSRAANFGLPANIVSIPLMGFWVMPMAIIALFLWPLGLDAPFWRAAAAGVDVMLKAGAIVGHLPFAVAHFSKWPPSALVVLTIGGLWLCLMRANWRYAGLVALPLAVMLIASKPHPQIFLAEDGENAGVLVADEKGGRVLAMFDRRKDRFAAAEWMEASGVDPLRNKAVRLLTIAPCDAAGCVIKIKGALLAISGDETGLDDDCARADLVAALYPVSNSDRRGCAARLIDRRDVWNNGAYALRVKRDGTISAESVRDVRGDRAWAIY